MLNSIPYYYTLILGKSKEFIAFIFLKILDLTTFINCYQI
ncbi:hypothetical protein SGADD02_00536 [Streptococcus gallolyticus]|uniref:Uncharacterized protein n=1 Tax=Streptococcus gallolyticus TaxID=315405 RepID=A0A139QNW9_9STRE|nr:hypothetical protein SGADD02_00536 [Streptococcus gallolyticus]KXU04132.1 hypothetical protein SGADD03_01983 [Streptococcus gallolyticus]